MSRHPLIGLLAFLALCTMDARSEPPPQRKGESEIGHLVPVAPYPNERHRAYITACHGILRIADLETTELFVAQKHGTAVMVRRPSFQPEECLALKEKSKDRKYEIIHRRAGRNVWYAIENEGEKGINEIPVSETIRRLDKDRAVRIYALWARMLRRVRYPEEGPRAGCPDDGETIEFRYTWKGMYGETCSPSQGSPKMMADLGNALILYCLAPDNQLKKTLELVDKKCDDLERLLNSGDGAKNE